LRSLFLRLSLWIACFVTASAAIAPILSFLKARADFNAAMHARAAAIADMASPLQDASMRNDAAACEEFCRRLIRQQDASYARLWGPDGALLACVGMAEGSVSPPRSEEGEQVGPSGDSRLITRKYSSRNFAELRVFPPQKTAEAGGVCVVAGFSTANYDTVRAGLLGTTAATAVMSMAILTVGLWLMRWRILTPLRELNSQMAKVAQGDLSGRIKITTRDEIGSLGRSFNDMTEQLADARREMEQYQARLEKTVDAVIAQLIAAQQRAAQSERLAALGRLAAGVAHEINNPLMAIQLTCHYLESDAHDPDAAEQLRNIQGQVERCKNIIQKLISFSETGEMSLSQFDARELAGDILTPRRQRLDEIGVSVRTEMPDAPVDIVGDRLQLRQCLGNILDNAMFAVEGRHTREISVAVSTSTEGIRIAVSDTGSGIDRENLKHIFEPFYTTKDVGQGSGLGLAISHGIAARHRGRIEVITEPDKGSTFILILDPRGPADAEKSQNK